MRYLILPSDYSTHILGSIFRRKKKCADNNKKMVINYNKVHGSQSSTVASEEQPE
jgi:hypothetical protein